MAFEISGKQWNAIVDVVNASIFHGYDEVTAVREDIEITAEITQDGVKLEILPAEFTVKPETE